MLTCVAKTWYQGLNSILHNWTEWKGKLIESFPCRQDYVDLFVDILAKHARLCKPEGALMYFRKMR